MVMRSMENEHGCTLSRSAETKTSGRSQAPLLLKLQITDDVAVLFLRNIIQIMTAMTTANIMVILFILLRSYHCFYFKLKCSVLYVGHIDKPVYHANSGRTMSIRVIDHLDIHGISGFYNLVRRNVITHPLHTKRSFLSIGAFNVSGSTHTRSINRLNFDVFSRRVCYFECMADQTVRHRYFTEIVDSF